MTIRGSPLSGSKALRSSAQLSHPTDNDTNDDLQVPERAPQSFTSHRHDAFDSLSPGHERLTNQKIGYRHDDLKARFLKARFSEQDSEGESGDSRDGFVRAWTHQVNKSWQGGKLPCI
jgi:hypothetical protein